MGGHRCLDCVAPVRCRHPGATPRHWPVRPHHRPLGRTRPASHRVSGRLHGRASRDARAGPGASGCACLRPICLPVPSLRNRALADASAPRWPCPSGHDPQSQDPGTRKPASSRERNAVRPLRGASSPDSGNRADASDHRIRFTRDGVRARTGLRGGADQRLVHAQEDDCHVDGPPRTPRSPIRQGTGRPRRAALRDDRGGPPNVAGADPPLVASAPADRGQGRAVSGGHSLCERKGGRRDGRSRLSLDRRQTRSRHGARR